MDYTKLNQEVWDKNVENEYIWSRAVSSEEIRKAKKGEWDIVLTPEKTVPKEWFPGVLLGKEVLCLASGGGQQGPIMAAVGANVTVLDNSKAQLGQDLMVAKRDKLTIKTIQGDMRDLSMFADESFDFIIHPWSNSFVDSIIEVWQESYRILKHGGIMISGFANPIQYIFDLKSMNENKLVVRHKIPYSDLIDLSEKELDELVISQGDSICFGHTLEDQIGGQIEAGFVIEGFYEDVGGSPLDQYIYSSMATKAIKL